MRRLARQFLEDRARATAGDPDPIGSESIQEFEDAGLRGRGPGREMESPVTVSETEFYECCTRVDSDGFHRFDRFIELTKGRECPKFEAFAVFRRLVRLVEVQFFSHSFRFTFRFNQLDYGSGPIPDVYRVLRPA